MPEPLKILEISGDDWMKGIVVHPYMAVGGLFQKATNFDPFRKVGLYVPSQSESSIGTGVVTVEARWIIPFASSTVAGVTYFHAFGPSTLYTGRTSQGALPGGGNGFIEDQSSRMTAITPRGAIKYKDKIVYFGTNNVIANSIPIPRVNAEVTLLTGLTTSYAHVPHIAPDKNLYFTNSDKIGRITSVTGASGNDASYFSFESDAVTRGITDDGQHLIIVGDNQNENESTPAIGVAQGDYRCFAAFWNMKSQDFTRIWEFRDNFVIGAVSIEDETVIFGQNNVYVCSVNSRPKSLLIKGGNSTIQQSAPEPGSIIRVNNQVVLWGGEGYSGDGDNKDVIYGYGRLHSSLPKSLFTMNRITAAPSGTKTIFSLMYDNGNTNNLIASYGNSMYMFTVGNNTSTLILAGIDFKKPYEFSFAKVVLDQKLDTSQSVDVEIISGQGDNVVLRQTNGTTNSFSKVNFPGKKSHIFYPYPGSQASSSIALFEDLSDITIKNVGANVKRFEIWGKPIKPDQDIYR